MENLDPPPPQIKDGKMARFCSSRAFILDLGGGGDGGLLFHFILSKIVDTKIPKNGQKNLSGNSPRKCLYKPQFYL